MLIRNKRILSIIQIACVIDSQYSHSLFWYWSTAKCFDRDTEMKTLTATIRQLTCRVNSSWIYSMLFYYWKILLFLGINTPSLELQRPKRSYTSWSKLRNEDIFVAPFFLYIYCCFIWQMYSKWSSVVIRHKQKYSKSKINLIEASKAPSSCHLEN